ncbi:MAG TPA: ABC transporter permease [Bryobacteraceae bacterium]|nr:ABC transporter permease [Bryobacteraceae bacterium]
MDWLLRDLLFSLRTLRKDRASLFLSLLALALGVGSTTAMFSVIDNILLEPWPYVDGNRLSVIEIHDSTSNEPYGRTFFSQPEFAELQKHSHIFRDIIAAHPDRVLWMHGSTPESLQSTLVSGNAFQVLGVAPLMGRFLLPVDAKPGAPAVFAMSYKMWQAKFFGSRDLLGKTFTFDGKPTTLIGIMPPRFTYFGADVWQPRDVNPAETAASAPFFLLTGHLKPELTLKTAQPDIALVVQQLSKAYPKNYPKKFDVRVISLTDMVVGQFRRTLYLLLGAVGLLLLIACANVANLLLAKATAREKELAVRSSLGAGKWQIVRLLLTESMLLALVGAALGVILAWAELHVLVAILPVDTFPSEAHISLNGRVLVAATVLAALTAILFGLAPALGLFASNLNEPLKAGGRGNSGFRRGRLRNLLIIGEVALSLILLTAAGLMMRSFFLMRQADLGFRPERMVTTQIRLAGNNYRTAEKQALFGEELTTRLRALPGVLNVTAAVDFPPFGGIDTDFEVPGKTHTQTWKGQMAFCDPQFFPTVGMRVLRGRLLTPADITGKRKVAVVNQQLARRFFPGEDPIGRQIKLLGLEQAPEPIPNPTFEIVGVVSDIKNHGLREAVVPQTYSPLTLSSYGIYIVFIRTISNPATLTKALDGTVLAMDRNLLPQQTNTVEESINQYELAQPRFGLEMFSAFAAIGLLLVSVGVYSVVSYTVSQQLREIGIRMALGGTGTDIRNWVLRSGMRFILIGIFCGFAIAFVLLRLLKSEISGINAADPITLVFVIVLLACVGFLACCVPALRATRVDPATALRLE